MKKILVCSCFKMDGSLDKRCTVPGCNKRIHANGYTLDKIDNNKDYGPDNCRWVDKQTQSVNRSNVKEPYITVRDTKKGKRYDVRIRDLSYSPEYKYKRGVFMNLNDAIVARNKMLFMMKEEGLR